MSLFTNLFKNNKVDIEVSIFIRDLINIPLVSGFYYINWKIKNISGTTERIHIKNHKVIWNQSIHKIIQVTINKYQILNNLELKLEIFQQSGKEIGNVLINLSEYVGLGLHTERYLLKDCKFNSTLKISLQLNSKLNPSLSFQNPPLSKNQFISDLPFLIHERKSLNSTKSNIRKSISIISLPKYCELNSTCDPSPNDVVDKLFANFINPI